MVTLAKKLGVEDTESWKGKLLLLEPVPTTTVMVQDESETSERVGRTGRVAVVMEM